MKAAELLAEAHRRGLEIYVDGDRVRVRPASRLDRDFLETLRKHKAEIIEYLASGWPCRDCGGGSGHTIRCPKGPGPAAAPHPGDLLRAAALLEWPELRVGRKTVAARGAAWEAFARRATGPEILAAFEALEALEARWRAEAPTARGVTR